MPERDEGGVTLDDLFVKMPFVKSRCKTCLRNGDWSGPGVISPTGIEHAGADYGQTECGKDATGDRWWWPL